MPKNQSGLKKGSAGGLHDGHSDIGDNVFSKDWATPLNASNSKQPGPGPAQGGVTEADSMGGFPNPLGIPNVGAGKGK